MLEYAVIYLFMYLVIFHELFFLMYDVLTKVSSSLFVLIG